MRFILIILVSVFATSALSDEIKSSDIQFPGKYYTTKLESCSAISTNITFDNSQVTEPIDGDRKSAV